MCAIVLSLNYQWVNHVMDSPVDSGV